jgi:DNA-binding transcriptional ArsR family regulator
VDSFAALADPTRRRIVDLLNEGERDAGTIAAAFPMSRPAISRHLRVLRDAGVVDVRAEAQRRIYALNPTGLMQVDRWLSKYRVFWAGRLDALDQALAEGETT